VEPYERAVPEGQEAWLILYSTVDSAGAPTVGSGVVVAATERGTDPLPTVTIAPGTNGIIPECAPSLKNNIFVTGHEHALTEHLIPAGCAGVIADYNGLGTRGPHAYLDGETAARNVLDARLAAAQIPELALDETTVIWGHSQGGGAALWTAAISAEYAPDLEVQGMAAAAPAADLPTIAADIADATAGKTITAYLVRSWQEAFDDDTSEFMTAGYQPIVDRISQRCFEGRDALANLADASQLSSPILQKGALGSFGELLAAKIPPAISQSPVLIAQGESDQLIRAARQREFAQNQCDSGQNLEYRSYPNLDHMPPRGTRFALYFGFDFVDTPHA